MLELRRRQSGAARFCNACGRAFEQGSSEPFRKTVTILFSDLVESTSLGERLDPETLSDVLADYLEGVKPVVERHGGTLAAEVGRTSYAPSAEAVSLGAPLSRLLA